MRASRPKDLLRFITCGSVDDGKSTLIGRLLHDSKLIYDDQLSSLFRDSARHGTTGDDIDFALSWMGLKPSVSRVLRSTSPTVSSPPPIAPSSWPIRRDTSNTRATWQPAPRMRNWLIILIDARKGVLVQTRRHSLICSLLGIRHVVIAINKIDLVNFPEGSIRPHRQRFYLYAAQLGFESIMAIPISARFGDNVIELSDAHAMVLGRSVAASTWRPWRWAATPRRGRFASRCNGSIGRRRIFEATPARSSPERSRSAIPSSSPPPGGLRASGKSSPLMGRLCRPKPATP